jgi:hypothetical protein
MPLAYGRVPLTKISSRSGKTQTPTSPFSNKPMLSTRRCNSPGSAEYFQSAQQLTEPSRLKPEMQRQKVVAFG